MIRAYAAIALSWVALAPWPAVAQDMPLGDLLIPGEHWQVVSEGHRFTEAPAVDRHGNVYFSDVPAGKIHKLDAATGEQSTFVDDGPPVSGLMFGPDNKLYGCHIRDRRLARYDEHGAFEIIADDLGCNDLFVTDSGDIYCTDTADGRVWLARPGGQKRVVDSGLARPNGVIAWNDQRTLVVADSAGARLWTYRVEDDGGLAFKQPYYTLRTPPNTLESGADGMAIDTAGRLYCATRLGLQVFDPTGRESGLIVKPQEAFLSNVALGGAAFDTLYVTSTDKVFARRVRATGRQAKK